MRKLKAIADEATTGINELLVNPLTDEQAEKVSEIVENVVIRALLEGRHRAVDAARRCAEHDEKQAEKYSDAIRHDNDVLIATLSSLR